VKTQSVNSLGAPVFSPAGVKFSNVPGNVQSGGIIVANTFYNSSHLGHNAGDKGYIAFEFQDTTHNTTSLITAGSSSV